jgi:hypothetical protein
MESEIQQDPKQKTRYGSAPLMTPKEKQISFYNRYFVFKKLASVDVEDVFQSVTGVHVFQEKLNRRDTLAAQMVASQLMLEEGEGIGQIAVSSKGLYRPTKERELKSMGEKGEKGEKGVSLGLSAAELESADTKLSKLFGSKSKEKESLGKVKSKGAEVSSITLKKKSALEPVKLPSKGAVAASASASAASDAPGEASSASASIIEKSKLGMKETSVKRSIKLNPSLGASGSVSGSVSASSAKLDK